MEFKFQHIFILLSVTLVGSYAALPSQEDYWRSMLPNSPMPKVVKDLLHPEWMEDKSTNVGVTKGGVNVKTGPGKPGGTTVGVGKGGVGVNTGKAGKGTNVAVGKGGVGVNTGKGTNVGVGKGGVVVGTRTKSGKPIYVGVTPSPVPFLYLYAAEEKQIHDNPNVALFFLEKDLHKGNTMKLHFFRSVDEQSSFLPRQIADSIPFSSEKFPQILDRFTVTPGSDIADVMKKTIQYCEDKPIKGEEKYCATSLESMVDFSTSKLGRKVEAISTAAEKETQLEKFKIVGVKKMPGEKAVVCHKLKYTYAVFYCHKTETTAAYKVVMVGNDDGAKVEAVAVCHKDTAAWNPKHLAFQVLKVKPGSVPVCHFLPDDHIVWVPKY